MKFDYISDLHVDFHTPWESQPSYDGISSIYPWHLEKQSDVLVIAGDMANDVYASLAVIDEASKFYDEVIFTDGNHDHYSDSENRTVSQNTQVMRNYYEANASKVCYLDGDTFYHNVFNETLFIGANGWYDWTANKLLSRDQQYQNWLTGMADSGAINFDQGGMPDEMAYDHANALREQVEWAQDAETVKSIVVVTHTIPHLNGVVPDTHPWGPLNGSFVNMFMEQVWIADSANKIKLWLFGHTHFNYDFTREGIRFINHSRGYPNEFVDTTSKIIQLDTDDDSGSAFESLEDDL